MTDLEYRIAKLSVSPGDVLVVKVDRPITNESGASIRDSVASYLPTGARVLVLGDAIDLSVLTKAEIDARTGGLAP